MSSRPQSAGIAVFGGVAFPGKGMVTGVLRGTVAIDPASLGAGAKASSTATVVGLDPTTCFLVQFTPPAALETGLVPIAARVSATDTIQVDLYNPTAAPIDGASRSWEYLIICTA
jgi:hypothetical protein